tara:strand:+ start:234 stop:419 length:186 start_codon:yes stop_codon:yes gene_type:complete
MYILQRAKKETENWYDIWTPRKEAEPFISYLNAKRKSKQKDKQGFKHRIVKRTITDTQIEL